MREFKSHLVTNPSHLYLFYFCCLIIFMGMIASLATDMYVPSLPFIATSFSATATAVKWTITFYYISFAFGQLCYGPLMDSFGRKNVVLIALIVGVAGSVLCARAPSLAALYVGRLFQGAGFASTGVAAMSIARDVLSHQRFMEVGSILSTVFGLGPVISPIIGAYVEHAMGWRMTFVIQSGYAALSFLLIVVLLSETHPPDQRHIFHIKPISKAYFTIIRNHFFLGNILAKAVAMAGFVIFYSITPFMLQDHLGVSVVAYGWITLALSGAILISKLLNTYLLRRINIDSIIWAAILILLTGCVLLLIFALLQWFNLFVILFPFSLVGIAAGFLFSTTTTQAFKPFTGMAASISGLMGFICLFATMLASAVASHVSNSSLLPLSVLMISLAAIATVGYYFLARRPSIRNIHQ